MGDQTFNCWWTTYPRTHVRAGQTVEVITREAYDGMVRHLQKQIDSLQKISDGAQTQIVSR